MRVFNSLKGRASDIEMHRKRFLEEVRLCCSQRRNGVGIHGVWFFCWWTAAFLPKPFGALFDFEAKHQFAKSCTCIEVCNCLLWFLVVIVVLEAVATLGAFFFPRLKVVRVRRPHIRYLLLIGGFESELQRLHPLSFEKKNQRRAQWFLRGQPEFFFFFFQT